MQIEELEFLPRALLVLTADDWRALDEAFASNQGPLPGHPVQAQCQQVFDTIVRRVPAPIGLREPSK